ncbi:hypothetical protein [Crocinitomix algicola]|uniref:hypothetical protein n=1 Tax=Crocinitomix algicola TaxID=1740263 RepID=UPI0008731494|nr:hypothetical protein [Crocinitomix algicola]
MKLKTLLVGAVAGLLLTACGGGETPDNVTKSFVQALADGDCDKAKGLAVDDALANVESAIENGCEAYETEIKSVECETEDETATCTCVEEREMEMTYKYELTKVEGNWKVASYEKDLNMDMDNFGGEAAE